MTSTSLIISLFFWTVLITALARLSRTAAEDPGQEAYCRQECGPAFHRVRRPSDSSGEALFSTLTGGERHA